LEVLTKLCEKYDGKIYQNGVLRHRSYLPRNMVNDIKATLTYNNKKIIIKKILRFNPCHIYMPIKNEKSIQISIRLKSLLNAFKSVIGKGHKVIDRYEFLGETKYIDRIIRNRPLINAIILNDLTIDVTSHPNPAILLIPFKGIESVKSGEDYFGILDILEQIIEV